MTDEEWIKQIPSLSATALLEYLDYCGYDSYYRTIREPVVAEIDKRLKKLEQLEKENELAKSLLYCTKRTCDNCGFVKCENFQMQRKSVPCDLYISYQDRIKNLEHESKENAELKEINADLKQSLDWANERESEDVKRIEELEEEIFKLKRIVKMVAMINKGIYTEEGIKAIYAEAEQFLKE